MNRDRIEELWSKFLAHQDLSAADERELLDALQDDPALRRTLLQEARVDGWLRVRASDLRDSEAPIRRFLKQVGAEKDESGFIKKMESRLATPTRRKTARPAPPGPSSWNLLLAAAGVIVGIVALVALLSEPTRHDAPKVVRPTPSALETRRVVEAKLQEIDRERERLTQPPSPQEKVNPNADIERRKALAELDERRKRTEQELNEAIERATPRPVVRTEETPVVPEPPTKDRTPAPATESAVAVLERIEGEVQIVGKDGTTPARAEQSLRAGQGLESGAKSLAVLRYPDGTRLEIGEGTRLSNLRDAAKGLLMERGSLRSQIAKQPKGQPMIFATPHGEAKVLGTTLRLLVDPDPKKGSRLDVEEGKVEFKNLAGKTVLVESGHYAVAAAGSDIVAKAFPIEEIVLLAASGKVTGSEWRPVKDDKALRGQAWETNTATTTGNDTTFWKDFNSAATRVTNHSAAFVEFRFSADAEKDYIIWVRSASLATGPNAAYFDQVAIEFANARVSKTWSIFKDNPGTVEINGHALKMGYWWVSGDADTQDVTQTRPADTVPVTVRFARGGTQVLRLYSLASLARVDAILLTTIRKTRPEDSFVPPGAELK